MSEYIIGAILIVFSLLIILVVLLQEGRQAYVGVISGAAVSFRDKGAAKTLDMKLAKWTKYIAIGFFVLVLGRFLVAKNLGKFCLAVEGIYANAKEVAFPVKLPQRSFRSDLATGHIDEYQAVGELGEVFFRKVIGIVEPGGGLLGVVHAAHDDIGIGGFLLGDEAHGAAVFFGKLFCTDIHSTGVQTQAGEHVIDPLADLTHAENGGLQAGELLEGDAVVPLEGLGVGGVLVQVAAYGADELHGSFGNGIDAVVP